MKYTYKQAALWAALYALLAMLPLAFVLVDARPAARPFLVEFGVGLGFVGMAMMALQFLLTGRFKDFAAGFGVDNQLQFHRHMGIVAFFFIMAHPLVLFAHNAGYLSFFDPRANLPRALALSGVVVLLVLIVGLTLWRKVFRIPYEWWRISHGVFSALVVVIGLIHILQVGYHVGSAFKQGLWIGVTAIAVVSLVYTRLFRPLRLRKYPWEIVDVRAERGECWTMALEPIDHDGLDFVPGQFCWLTVGDSPFSLQQHPFSVSSSAEEPTRVEFTMKELGDFTGSVKDIDPGRTAFVEGPYGAFSLGRECKEDAVFFAAGVGITPIISILRTLRDRGMQGRYLLYYANPAAETILFRDELDALADELDLEIVYVVEHPPDRWDGEVGLLTDGLIGEYLPEDDEACRYYVCGPEPMMDMVETALVERDISRRRIMSERFEIV